MGGTAHFDCIELLADLRDVAPTIR
jgi:hypothetical protein